MSYTSEPMIQSCDTGEQMPYFDSCQLTITWMSNIIFKADCFGLKASVTFHTR